MSWSSSAAGWAMALLLIAGCPAKSRDKAEGSVDGSGALTSPEQKPPDGDGTFEYTRVQRARAPVPARFSAPLPTSEDELRRVRAHPPAGMVAAAICSGDVEMRGRLLSAARAAAARGTLTPDLVAGSGRYLGWCSSEEKCGWLREVVLGPDDVAVRQALWQGLLQCPGPEHLEAMSSADAPAELVLDWYIHGSFGGDYQPPFTPRLARAAFELASSGQPYQVRRVGFILGRMHDPRAFRTLMAVRGELEDDDARALLLLGLQGSDDPRAERLFEWACMRASMEHEPVCRADHPQTASGKTAQRSLAELVRDWSTDVVALARSQPAKRGRIESILERCAGSATHEGALCLTRLALLDRPKATRIAQRLLPSLDPSSPIHDAAFPLARYPEPGALAERLLELKLITRPTREEPGATVEDLLTSAGVATRFDTETGQFPNEHDVLLAELAELTGPLLEDVVFEERAPLDEGGAYVLRAYDRGQRLSARARNLGDWFDVGAVIGLLNVVLRDRGSELRFVSAPTGDQTALLIVAPKQALIAARTEGLIRFQSP